ncbi:carbohydrate-binding module family 21 protein [Cucurbitaria berberidis CBS 394.84]|uniref:Carbohydrate-binding module family 21 protein n=1 Tax=Cucurbitaria berberidis CBS 394.84 TaxID=1168544 RepID=A0A9P4GLV4_9PLEO|nr:carbohydrate-binding module family 21 protein [Cucurbitaria berberidis CBS 394.84]KAF1847569.1 carbohydrate-binding module family 21 protein [Cucurbitaria berberidis CBS 394.84]
MPYTPPSNPSPASSRNSSPILSRNHSYIDQTALSPASSQRPALPRSVSSTSYLHKSRRSPSLSSVDNNTAANGQMTNGSVLMMADTSRARGHSKNGSLRPSPLAVNHLLIPPGAITTPPESDDDERGRNIGNLQELQEALQHINVKRMPSPQRVEANSTPKSTTLPMTAARSLSAEARKISHSRSSSEITLSQHMIHPLITDPVISSSDGSDAEDDELRIKPPLLRKKSGELVKPALRPPSRRRPSSMPGTPTYSKAVHFNEDIEQVRHFLMVDRPIAVSAGSSPVETYDSETEYPFSEDSRTKTPEWEIKLTNFPTTDTHERQSAPVRVERIFLASDNQTLVGNIACANISFHKYVVARFTLDYWKTTSEVVAEFNHDVRKKQKEDGYDRFNFNIKLADQANLESKTLLLCVRYTVNGQEFWDNNNSMNYQVDFLKKVKPRESKRSNSGLGAIPRSRHSPLAARPRSMPAASIDDDFGHEFENKFQFGSGRGIIHGDSPNSSIKLKPRSKRGSLFPDQAPRTSQVAQAFASRYDFGASLTAALSTAQTTLGERSGLKVNTSDVGKKGYFDHPAPAPKARTTAGTPVPGTRPDSLSLEKPGLQSAEYNELIQKFCFFGTPTGKISPLAATPATSNVQSDGAMDYMMNNSSGSNQSSATSSPPSPAMPLLVDGANDMMYSRSASPFLSRSNSPGPVTGTGPEDHMTSQYQHGYKLGGGMFYERSHTPTACV